MRKGGEVTIVLLTEYFLLDLLVSVPAAQLMLLAAFAGRKSLSYGLLLFYK